MPNLYIEALPKGCPEGSATDASSGRIQPTIRL
jgi:hypothetical protein